MRLIRMIKSSPKLCFGVFLIAVLACNFHSERDYQRSVGLTHSEWDLTALGILVCGIGSIKLYRRVYKTIRDYLASGRSIPRHVKLCNFRYAWFFAPLFIRWSALEIYHLPDNTLVSHTWGYGSEGSIVLFIAAVLFLTAFQMKMNLAKFEFTEEFQLTND